MESNTTYSWTPPKAPEKPVNPRRFGKKLLLGLLAVVLVVGALSCFYTVDEKQQAIVTTFGKMSHEPVGPGLHFKLPFGIQQVHKVDVNVYQKIEIGYNTLNGTEYSIPEESAMITGDYNIVNVDFLVEYKISNPEKYLFSSSSPELILKNLIQSQVRNVVGSSTVDAVLTDGKEEIQYKIKALVSEILEEYDIGLTLIEVRIQDAEPPTSEVMEAFKSVETAKQNAQAVVNQAEAYENAQIPAAEAQADKLLQDAEYQKTKRINEAIEAVAMFNAMFEQYRLNPEITKARMYYETIQQILPGVTLYINAGDGQLVLVDGQSAALGGK